MLQDSSVSISYTLELLREYVEDTIFNMSLFHKEKSSLYSDQVFLFHYHEIIGKKRQKTLDQLSLDILILSGKKVYLFIFKNLTTGLQKSHLIGYNCYQ